MRLGTRIATRSACGPVHAVRIVSTAGGNTSPELALPRVTHRRWTDVAREFATNVEVRRGSGRKAAAW